MILQHAYRTRKGNAEPMGLSYVIQSELTALLVQKLSLPKRKRRYHGLINARGCNETSR